MELDALFAAGHGVLTRAELASAGIGWRRIQSALKRNQIRRISRGRYATMEDLGEFGKARALNGVVSGLSALSHFGVWVPAWHRPSKLQIRVTRNVRRKHIAHPFRRKTSRQVTVRVLSLLVPDSYTEHPRGRGNGRRLRAEPVDNIATAILVAEEDCSWDELVAIGDSALRQGVSMSTLQDIARFGGAKLRRAFSLLDASSSSGAESLVRARLGAAGLRIRTQYGISRMHVDGLIGSSLVIEIDGVAYHRSPEQVLSDRRRDRVLQALGYVVLRFTASEVYHEWERVLREILLFVRAKKHRRRVRSPEDLDESFGRWLTGGFATA